MTATAAARPDIVESTVLADLGRAVEAARADPGMLSEDVYCVLHDAISSGRIPAGTHLSQIPLAVGLGVSRTPVRDALLRLAQEGLIRSIGGRGYVVVALEIREVAEIYEVRGRLVEWALGLVQGHITPSDLWEARRVHQEMSHPEHLEASRYFELNRQFHRAFIQSCPNRTLLALIDRLWELPTSRRMFLQYNADHAHVAKMIREHAAILDTAERGDHDALVRLVLDHISDAAVDTSAFIASDASRPDDCAPVAAGAVAS